MDFKNELHSKALVAAKNFKEAERTLQEVLREIDYHKVYYDLGYRSLQAYAISALGLTPDVAYNHCTVAQKARDLPEIRKAIAEGAVSVTAVRYMAPVLTKENQKEMVSLASTLTQSELRREVAKLNPEKEEVAEKARYVREDRLALELRVSDELMKKLRRAQDVVSQSKREFSSLEDTLEAMVEVFLEKKDPLRKAERAQEKEVKSPTLPIGDFRFTRKGPSKRVALPAWLKHRVLARSGGRCMANNPDGSRCEQTRWLHTHHIKPLSEGGTNDLENLTVLCSGHHRMIHRKMKA
jgi:hypothetical protein